jgi:hypothetical protein
MKSKLRIAYLLEIPFLDLNLEHLPYHLLYRRLAIVRTAIFNIKEPGDRPIKKPVHNTIILKQAVKTGNLY